MTFHRLFLMNRRPKERADDKGAVKFDFQLPRRVIPPELP